MLPGSNRAGHGASDAPEVWMRWCVAVGFAVGCTGKDDASESSSPAGEPEWDAFVFAIGSDSTAAPGAVLAGFTPHEESATATTWPSSPSGCSSDTTTTPTVSTTPPAYDAGTITVLLDDDPYELNGFGFASTPWPAGAALGLEASGGADVPPVEVHDLVVLPPLPSGSYAAAGDGSIDVTWADPGGEVAVVVVADESGAVWCVTDDDGAFTVPAADLAGLSGTWFVQVIVQNTAVADSDDGVLRAWALAQASGAL